MRHIHLHLLRYCLLPLLLLSSTLLQAQEMVTVQNPWVRTTNAAQNISAGYMTLTSSHDLTLTKVSSDVTDSVEIHSMKMENNVMKMRMLDALPLVAGKPYKLESGGYHLMLFDLKKPLLDGQTVNFELTFKNSQNVVFKQKVKAAVRTKEDTSNASNHGEHGHHHSH